MSYALYQCPKCKKVVCCDCGIGNSNTTFYCDECNIEHCKECKNQINFDKRIMLRQITYL